MLRKPSHVIQTSEHPRWVSMKLLVGVGSMVLKKRDCKPVREIEDLIPSAGK